MNSEAQHNKLRKSSIISFFVWLASLIVFYITILAANGNFANTPDILIIILLSDILVGILTYIAFFYYVIKSSSWGVFGLSLFVVFLFFFVLFYLPNAELQTQSSSVIDQNDPLIDCQVHVSCGGGTKRMKQSECVNSTCCQVGNVWVTLDKDACKLKQQEYSGGQQQQVQQAPRTIIQIPQFQPPQPPNVCCKESCNSFTGVCTTSCTRQWICL